MLEGRTQHLVFQVLLMIVRYKPPIKKPSSPAPWGILLPGTWLSPLYSFLPLALILPFVPSMEHFCETEFSPDYSAPTASFTPEFWEKSLPYMRCQTKKYHHWGLEKGIQMEFQAMKLNINLRIFLTSHLGLRNHRTEARKGLLRISMKKWGAGLFR